VIDELHVTLERIRTNGKKVLVFFLTAGYPTRAAFRELVLSLANAGADVIEIGMPFSDPLADGPVIQESSAVALKNGTTLETVLDDVRTIAQSTTVPVVLMGYVNPILRYGVERFFRDAAESGIKGLILPEVPLEESSRFSEHMANTGIAQILLVAPTTSPARAENIDAASGGFVYCVSSTGVTGSQSGDTSSFLKTIRSSIRKNPMYVGFGIATPDDVRAVAPLADGVIIGSALIRKVIAGEDPTAILGWVRLLREALDGSRSSSLISQ
jgi:tryptophan synthase alpha chain